MKDHFVFVYGALMANPYFRERAVPGKIKDHQIVMKVKGIKPFEPSFAVIEESPGEEAWGLIVQISEMEWKQRSTHEIVYMERELEAYDREGKRFSVKTLFLQKKEDGYPHEVNPSKRYSKILFDCARAFDFPLSVQKHYELFVQNGNGWSNRLKWAITLIRLLIPFFGKWGAYAVVMGGIFFLAFVVLFFFWKGFESYF